jgi:Xaa-Pro aminopeptidase
MVFNIEPAVYLPGYGGIRHCDTVAITEAGAELLTPFHSLLHDLRLAPEYYKAA